MLQLLLSQSAQRLCVHAIPVRLIAVVFFRRFQNQGDVGQSRVTDQLSESLQADFAQADVRVSVPSAAHRKHAVIHMDRPELVQADQRVELPHRLGVSLGGTNVIAGCEYVGGVQTHAEPVGGREGLQQGSELLEASPQTLAGPRGGLQQQRRAGGATGQALV